MERSLIQEIRGTIRKNRMPKLFVALVFHQFLVTVHDCRPTFP